LLISYEAEESTEYFFGNFFGPKNEVDFVAHLWEGGCATAAAPTYFPYFPFGMRFLLPLLIFLQKGTRKLVDGGVAANNPTEHAIRFSSHLWNNRDPSIVLSLGTGFSRTIDSISNGLTYWARKMADRATGNLAISILF
jgi:patatin-like phospholipase/acyl hydrolase